MFSRRRDPAALHAQPTKDAPLREPGLIAGEHEHDECRNDVHGFAFAMGFTLRRCSSAFAVCCCCSSAIALRILRNVAATSVHAGEVHLKLRSRMDFGGFT
jgi:hypothetical protein